jgi:cytochrome c oxidase cbb3-type subunit IV
MLRFITGNLTTIDGVSIYPIISLLIFVLFFAVMITRVVRMKKAEISELGKLPFEDDVDNNRLTKID